MIKTHLADFHIPCYSDYTARIPSCCWLNPHFRESLVSQKTGSPGCHSWYNYCVGYISRCIPMNMPLNPHVLLLNPEKSPLIPMFARFHATTSSCHAAPRLSAVLHLQWSSGCFWGSKKNKTWRLGEFKGKKMAISTEKKWDGILIKQEREIKERNDDDASIEDGDIIGNWV